MSNTRKHSRIASDTSLHSGGGMGIEVIAMRFTPEPSETVVTQPEVPRVQIKPTKIKRDSKSISNLAEREKKQLDPVPKPPLNRKPSQGPRLQPDTIFDREAVYAESRQRVKELTQQLRVGVQQRAMNPTRSFRKKKSTPDLQTQSKSEQDIFEKVNARLGSNDKLDRYSKQIKGAFGTFLVPEESEMLSGEVGYSDDMAQFMGETRIEEKPVNEEETDTIKVAGIQKSTRTHPVSFSSDALDTAQVPTSLQDLTSHTRRENYERLLSKVKIVPRTLVPVGKRSMASSNTY
jgi:hypothetical protein